MKNHAPETIDQLSHLFNNKWRHAWGMELR